jgi:ligand-binding sensor protein
MNHTFATLAPNDTHRNTSESRRVIPMPDQATTPAAKVDSNRAVLDRLAQSQVFKDYERAFGEATGLPLALSPNEDLHLTHHHRRKENPICALLAKSNKACSACLQTQHELANKAQETAKTVTCAIGLCESAVPLRIGEDLIGYLRTGEVLLRSPNERQFSRVAKQCAEWGVKAGTEELREAYFQSRVSLGEAVRVGGATSSCIRAAPGHCRQPGCLPHRARRSAEYRPCA